MPTPRLLVQPESLTWVVRVEDKWWLVGDHISALILCGYCEIRVDPQEFSQARESCRGKVYAEEGTEEPCCNLTFKDWTGQDGGPDLKLANDTRKLAFVSWGYGHHDDGWLEVSSMLYVEGATELELDVYLPTLDQLDDQDKGIEIDIDGQIVYAGRVARGDVTPVRIVFPEAKFGPVGLHIELEYAEPMHGNSDQRLLGCVVTRLGYGSTEPANSAEDGQ